MFYVIHQNNDLCEVSGYAFTNLRDALSSAMKRLGVSVIGIPAVVCGDYEQSNTHHDCCLVTHADGRSHFCREGQMTLIAQTDDVIHIATRLCRRNGLIYGNGKVYVDGKPVIVPAR